MTSEFEDELRRHNEQEARRIDLENWIKNQEEELKTAAEVQAKHDQTIRPMVMPLLVALGNVQWGAGQFEASSFFRDSGRGLYKVEKGAEYYEFELLFRMGDSDTINIRTNPYLRVPLGALRQGEHLTIYSEEFLTRHPNLTVDPPDPKPFPISYYYWPHLEIHPPFTEDCLKDVIRYMFKIGPYTGNGIPMWNGYTTPP